MTRDGRWFYIHASTDPQKMLNLLGCEGNKESVGRSLPIEMRRSWKIPFCKMV
jgi:hypothetical protein